MSGLAFPKPVRAEKTRQARKRKPPRRLSDPAKTDRQYLGAVHNMECVGQRSFPGHFCRRGLQASHFRHHTGASLKESDRMAIPMCGELHLVHWELYAGPFKGWTQEERKSWFLERLRETHREFVATYPERVADFYPAVIL